MPGKYKASGAHRRKKDKKRRKLYETQKQCHWCGLELTIDDRSAANFATLDHVVEISKGGSHGIENLVLACGPCNTSRSSKRYES
jgi:5-methylcytosine-specific restriction endonuclease McrA